MSHCETLGVSRSASESEIEAAFEAKKSFITMARTLIRPEQLYWLNTPLTPTACCMMQNLE